MSDDTRIGKLTILATPIGNLEDLTFRAVRMMGEADLIAAEDTRHAKKLLNHYEITTAVTSYHMHNESRKTESLLNYVRNGSRIVMLTDAGTPCLSDPGYILVKKAIEAGIEPEIIPGPSALTYAVSACALPVSDFHFVGFLPNKGAKRRRILRTYAHHSRTLFLYESPHRISKLLLEISEEIGEDTTVVLIREATKRFEEHIRGTAKELLEEHGERKWKGEFTVAIYNPNWKAEPISSD
jgi:16S rRNA (cytidine1402-2'-O)-methyltransferase